MTVRLDVRECPNEGQPCAEDGFMLIAVIIMVFLVLLVLSIAAPRMAQQLKREQDLEAKHRAEQYVVAIRKFYGTFGRYPSSIKELEGTNNQRFLRQEYEDPFTGKSDWRLIHLGENKTKVKGLFGEDLPGLSGGLGAAADLQSSPGAAAAGAPGGLAGAAAPGSLGGGLGSTPVAAPGVPSSSGLGSTPGATGTPGTTTASGTPGSSTTTDGFGSSGFPTTGGLIMGIGVPKSGESVASQNGESTYQKWEFLYDPRIEQLHAGWSVFGGGGPGSTPTSGLGGGQQNGSPGLTSGAGTSNTPGSGFGSSGGFGSGFGTSPQPGTSPSAPGTTPANPSAPAPQNPGTPASPDSPGNTSGSPSSPQ